MLMLSDDIAATLVGQPIMRWYGYVTVGIRRDVDIAGGMGRVSHVWNRRMC